MLSMNFRYNPFDCHWSEVSASDLCKLCSVAEGWYVEYKSTLIQPKKLAKSMSSFSNQYGGWLIFGIEEETETKVAKSFPGIHQEDTYKLIQDLKNASKDLINPEVFYQYRIFKGPITDINLSSEKCIIVIRIPPGAEPPYIHADGRIYRRVADSSTPKPETDRSTLDRLWERTEHSHARLKSYVTRRPVISKAEESNCYLHLSILSDPYEIRGDYFSGSFSEFADIMREDPNPFDNIFSRSGGFIARQTIGNDPYFRTLTWEFNLNCHSFITIPINLYSDPNIPKLTKYKYWSKFIHFLNSSKLSGKRLLDLNIIFEGLMSVTTRHRSLVNNAGVGGPFYVKAKLENLWRTVPFVDLTSFIEHIEKYGIPVVQDDDVLAPPGTDLNSFIILSEKQSTLDNNLQAIKDGILILMPIFDALGIPRELLEGDISSNELSLTGKIFKDVHKLRDRTTDR